MKAAPKSGPAARVADDCGGDAGQRTQASQNRRGWPTRRRSTTSHGVSGPPDVPCGFDWSTKHRSPLGLFTVDGR